MRTSYHHPNFAQHTCPTLTHKKKLQEGEDYTCAAANPLLLGEREKERSHKEKKILLIGRGSALRREEDQKPATTTTSEKKKKPIRTRQDWARATERKEIANGDLHDAHTCRVSSAPNKKPKLGGETERRIF